MSSTGEIAKKPSVPGLPVLRLLISTAVMYTFVYWPAGSVSAHRNSGQADACLQSVQAWCRDIKPENVFLHTGGILLGDWGLGIDDVQERPVSRVGTLDYMAPEVLSAPSIPPGVNFRVPASSRDPGSYDATVRPRSLRAHAAWILHGNASTWRAGARHFLCLVYI